MPFLKYFIFSFSFLAFFYSSSQTIVSYSEADGLLNNYVKCVAVDPNDNVWFGTAISFHPFGCRLLHSKFPEKFLVLLGHG